MPIYAYRCDTCGYQKEVLRKLSDPLLSVCPSCQAETFRKQVTAAGFQLKGSGWYATDFRGGAKPPAEGESKPAEKAEGATPAAAKASTGSEAAPVAAPAPAPAASSAPSSSPAASGN